MCHTPALMRASAAWQCMARRMRVSWRRTGDDHRAVGLLVLLHEILRASGAAPPVKIRGASPHPRLASPLSSCRARRYMEGFGVTARLWSNSKTKHPQQDYTRSSSFPLLLVSTRAAPGPGRSMLCGAMWQGRGIVPPPTNCCAGQCCNVRATQGRCPATHTATAGKGGPNRLPRTAQHMSSTRPLRSSLLIVDSGTGSRMR